MNWLYRLQHRIGLTRQECTALLFVVLVLLSGLVVRHVYSRMTLPAPATDTDRQFAERARSFRNVPEQRAGHAASPAGATPSVPGEPAVPARVNLNTATAPELERLPRIGPKLAARIVAYREAHGPFRRVADLVHVRGIGPKTLADLEPLLFVEHRP
ncbi:helix-hairpin-helix domain-containing protein [Rhodocaloribacter litoris]|uniref:ComEA family DNA-binding protein n=1 Tax=Rhodocaloribacter litoris TaxID=2558931 RepID=UPI001E4D42C8|nr:helix-hairpin-helix domain-containing protein [Rhodocaloribacter litoris]QXD15845.1 helix-hairpin-helix domain-containing protein [Rhodocaloribacter litoris]GIV57108.1 MAG: hypothetical protein KatS3mg042_0021 [Rhodothermaceae bacterium]